MNNNDSLIVCEYEKGTVKEIKYRTLVCDNQEWQFSQYEGCSGIIKTTHLFFFLRDEVLGETGINIKKKTCHYLKKTILIFCHKQVGGRGIVLRYKKVE